MIKWILKRSARSFGKRYDYDVSYMTDVIDVSAGAGLRLSIVPFLSQYRGPEASQSVWCGAVFASTLEGDCGPCVQLIIDMAIESGVDANHLQHCFEGDPQKGGDVGLGFRFAMAAIHGDIEADEIRSEIEAKYGKEAVVSASFAASLGRFYPVFKRGLGYGHACTKPEFRVHDKPKALA